MAELQNSMTYAEMLRRAADRISSLILYSDYPWVDIAIEIEKLREMVAAEFPDKMDLFEHLYISRFERLWEQWRDPATEF
jgi:hypothetical protein